MWIGKLENSCYFFFVRNSLEDATSLRKLTHCEQSAINSPLVNLHKLKCCKFSAQNCDKTCVLLAGKSCNVIIICIIARIRKTTKFNDFAICFPVYYNFSPNRIKIKASINIFLCYRCTNSRTDELQLYNLFVTSKNETKNSPIYEFKVLKDDF